MNAIQGVNTHPMHRGYLDAGVKDSEVVPFWEREPDSMLALPEQTTSLDVREHENEFRTIVLRIPR